MIKRFLLSFFSLLLLIFPSVVSAQEGKSTIVRPDIYPSPKTEPFFLGQNHYYSLVFRGNGESVVALKVILSNTEKSDLSQVELIFPSVKPENLTIYQLIRERACVLYRNPSDLSSPCLRYQEPSYEYIYDNQTKYLKADYKLEGDKLIVNLPVSLKPDQAGSCFVYFRAFGFADKALFNTFKYAFETLKVSQPINNLTIGIITDSNLKLKGSKGEVNYGNEVLRSDKSFSMIGPSGENPQLDRFISQIGMGDINKTASNLAGLETYEVRGMYGKSAPALYVKEIGVILIAVLSVLVIIILITALVLQKGTDKNNHKNNYTRPVLALVATSFFSSLFTVGYSVLIINITRFISRYGGFYNFESLFYTLLVIFSFAIYAVFLFGPALLFGLRKGWKWGVIEFFLALFFLLMDLLIVLFIMYSLNSPPEIMPLRY